jgi:hypothetical protein
LTTQISAPEQQDTAQRDGFMAALAAAEQFISASPVLPSSMDIRCYSWDPTPEAAPYFHDRPDAVRVFAEYFGGTVTERLNYPDRADSDVMTEARGEVNGVAFRAWALAAAQVEPTPLVISDDTIRQADALLELNIADREAAAGGIA